MGQMDSVQADLNHHIQNAEIVKVMVIEALVEEGVLKDEDGKRFAEMFGVILVKESWYKRIFKTATEKDWVFKIVKMVK